MTEKKIDRHISKALCLVVAIVVVSMILGGLLYFSQKKQVPTVDSASKEHYVRMNVVDSFGEETGEIVVARNGRLTEIIDWRDPYSVFERHIVTSRYYKVGDQVTFFVIIHIG